jgi:outer membrane murein-binding lipoprotein Lpp
MKKQNFGAKAAAIFGAALLLAGCASTQTESNLEDISNDVKTQIIEHQGTAWGTDVPSWVSAVQSASNQKALSKALGITDKKIWVLQKSGSNLDFLQTWVDQVDARAEIASSIKQTVGDAVRAELTGESSSSDAEIEKTVQRYSERVSAVTLAGLEKEQSFWTKTRRQEVDSDEYKIQYNYLVIYSMDEDLFEKQLKAAMENIGDTDNSALLNDAVTERVINAVIVTAD